MRGISSTRRVYIVCANERIEEAYLEKDLAQRRVNDIRERQRHDDSVFWHFHEVLLFEKRNKDGRHSV